MGAPFDTAALALLRSKVMLSGEVVQSRSSKIDQLRAQTHPSAEAADAPLSRERAEIGEHLPGVPFH